MKRVNDIAEKAEVSRQTVYNRIRKIEDIIGYFIPRQTDRDGFRIVDDTTAKMIINWKGQKPGRKPKMKNSSLTGITKEDIDEVLK